MRVVSCPVGLNDHAGIQRQWCMNVQEAVLADVDFEH